MAQATILATGTTAATSTDVVVTAGTAVTVGLFTSAATGIPAHEGAMVCIDTPGDDANHCFLSGVKPIVVLTGPGTYRVKRPVTTVSFGVFTE